MIGILNYGLGNITAFQNAYKILGIPCEIISDSLKISCCSHLILPGVGSFDYAMKRFKNSKLFDPVNKAVIEERKPILGVCVGMQMMFDSSDEGLSKGLSWIPGVVSKFSKDTNCSISYPIPHIGWNKVILKSQNKFIEGINNEEFYFLHSFTCVPNNKNTCLAMTKYGIDFTSIVKLNNIYGTQFHPEKSHSAGLRILSNFYNISND